MTNPFSTPDRMINENIPVFAARRIVAVVQNVAFEPGVADVAFCVPSNTTYTINGAGESATLIAGSVRGIITGNTYTFSTSFNLEVM